MAKNSQTIMSENLIFLFYIYDEKIEITDKKPECVDINPADGTWSFKGVKYQTGSFRRSMVGCRCGIYGVYDCTNIAHLRAMARHILEVTNNQENFWDK